MVPNTNKETVSSRATQSFTLGTRTRGVCSFFLFLANTSTTCSELISLSRWIFSNQSSGNRFVPIVERRNVFRRRMILNDISADAIETGMASKTWIHIVTFGYTSELVISRISVMQSDFTFVASHYIFHRWISRWNYSKSGKSPSNSVNIPFAFASFKWLVWVGSKYWAPHWRRRVWSSSRRWSMNYRYTFSFTDPVLTFDRCCCLMLPPALERLGPIALSYIASNTVK